MTEVWTQCRARSAEGTYCSQPDGHGGEHEDKWGMKWPHEASDERS